MQQFIVSECNSNFEDTTAREFVMKQIRTSGDFGVEGYTVRKTIELDKPVAFAWKQTKRPNFLDDQMKLKMKNCVPSTFYKVEGNLVQADHKSFLSKSPRTLHSEEISAWNKKFNFPGPGSHSPSDNIVKPRVLGAFNLKGEREHSSYLGDSIYKGAVSPKYYETKYDGIDAKVHSVRIIADKPSEKGPSFMAGPTATAKISPFTYSPLDSFVKT